MLLAVLAHGGVGALALARRPPTPIVLAVTAEEVVADLDEPRPAAEATGSSATSPTRDRGLVPTEPRTPRNEPRARTPDDVARPTGWSFGPSVTVASAPPTLGIGTLWKSIAIAPEAPRPRIERSIRDALAADDVERGFGRAGLLVTIVHTAASSPSAPETGTTTFEVDCDASGSVVDARAADSAWDEVAKAIVTLMNGRTIRSTPRGLHASLRVVAEHTISSGARGTTSAGAVPDDVPGGGRACAGAGLTRRCVAGLPIGLTYAQHDVSNVNRKPTRIVRVQLVEEK